MSYDRLEYGVTKIGDKGKLALDFELVADEQDVYRVLNRLKDGVSDALGIDI